MVDKRLFRLLLMVSLLSLAGGIILYPQLPSFVPIHWNVYGEVDSFGPRWISLLFMVMPPTLLVGLRLFPKLDPRGKNFGKNPRAYSIITVALVLPLILLAWMIYLPGLGINLPVQKFIPVLIGLLLLIMGNYMPQVRPNFFLGFRTPWALSNDTVWRKTNHMGGIAFCVSGISIILTAFLPPSWLQTLSMGLVVVSVVGVYIYSYVIYRRLNSGSDA